MNGYPKKPTTKGRSLFRKPGHMTRRELLKWQLTGGLLLASGGLALGELASPGPAEASDAPHAAVVKGTPAKATRAAVEALGGMSRFVRPGDKVVVKPNMSFPNPPETATNTHPKVMRAIVEMCRDAGAARVLVLDHTLANAEKCMERSGIRTACEAIEPGSVHALMNSRFYSGVDIPEGRAIHTTAVMEDVLESDVLIAAAKAKSHSGAGISMSLKGMMGLIWDRGALHRAGDLHQAIVDLNTVLPTALAVVDATTILSTGGPFGPGEVLSPGVVVASPDRVAADALAVNEGTWYGQRIEPRQVRHIRLAHEQGLGRMDIENLSVARMEL